MDTTYMSLKHSLNSEADALEFQESLKDSFQIYVYTCITYFSAIARKINDNALLDINNGYKCMAKFNNHTRM